MFGMMIDAGPKFYVVRSPTPYMTLRSRSRTSNFCIEVLCLSFYNICFWETFDGFIHVWHGDKKQVQNLIWYYSQPST